jgi:hypothetical protein
MKFSIFRDLCRFALLSLACTGCAVYNGGRVYSSPAWAKNHDASGKVFLIVAGRPSLMLPEVYVPRVMKAAVAVLQRLPDTMVLNATEIPTNWAADPSDSQAIALAKSRGADSVCVISVGRCSGALSLYFWPPKGLCLTTGVLYSLRLIDVHSGELLMHSVRSMTRGGWWCICNPYDARRDIKTALSCDFWEPPDHRQDGKSDSKS